jgi:hypothetical protein
MCGQRCGVLLPPQQFGESLIGSMSWALACCTSSTWRAHRPIRPMQHHVRAPWRSLRTLDDCPAERTGRNAYRNSAADSQAYVQGVLIQQGVRKRACASLRTRRGERTPHGRLVSSSFTSCYNQSIRRPRMQQDRSRGAVRPAQPHHMSPACAACACAVGRSAVPACVAPEVCGHTATPAAWEGCSPHRRVPHKYEPVRSLREGVRGAAVSGQGTSPHRGEQAMVPAAWMRMSELLLLKHNVVPGAYTSGGWFVIDVTPLPIIPRLLRARIHERCWICKPVPIPPTAS